VVHFTEEKIAAMKKALDLTEGKTAALKV